MWVGLNKPVTPGSGYEVNETQGVQSPKEGQTAASEKVQSPTDRVEISAEGRYLLEKARRKMRALIDGEENPPMIRFREID